MVENDHHVSMMQTLTPRSDDRSTVVGFIFLLFLFRQAEFSLSINVKKNHKQMSQANVTYKRTRPNTRPIRNRRRVGRDSNALRQGKQFG